MRGFRKEKIWKRDLCIFLCFPAFLLFTPTSHSDTSKNHNTASPQINTNQNLQSETEELKIKTQPTAPSVLKNMDEEDTNTNLIDVFNTTLFETSETTDPSSSLIWLHNPEIKEKRNKIIGSQSNIFESWWKIRLDAFLLENRLDYTEVIRTRIHAKVITSLMKSFFAHAEFELLTGSGSIQKIHQRLGETNGISQREVLFSYKATNWLTLQFGAINQRFLQSPLLLAQIPFPSLVENIELFKGKEHHLSLSFQQAIPTTFSASHSIYTQSLSKSPLLITKSFFWNYDPKSYYKVTLNSTFFHYNPLPSDIARTSKFYGNTVVEEPAKFKYRYTGFYIGLEPSFQIFSNLGLKMKLHYINNIRKTDNDNLNQGILYSWQFPFDITENIRVTPVFEYFINQPDSSVGYYNSERYGHSDRTGFVGEFIFNFYNRNMEVGFRHLRSRAVRRGGLKQAQIYYLLFLRTNYARI